MDNCFLNFFNPSLKGNFKKKKKKNFTIFVYLYSCFMSYVSCVTYFFGLTKWDDLVDLGSVPLRPKTSQETAIKKHLAYHLLLSLLPLLLVQYIFLSTFNSKALL